MNVEITAFTFLAFAFLFWLFGKLFDFQLEAIKQSLYEARLILRARRIRKFRKARLRRESMVVLLESTGEPRPIQTNRKEGNN